MSKILCEETELEYNLSTLDTFDSVKFISDNTTSIVRVALVCNSNNFPDAQFWESVTFNRGLTVKVFIETEQAEKWLNAEI